MDDKIKITYPSSEKVYMTGKLHPEIKVGMRKVLLTPTVTVDYDIWTVWRISTGTRRLRSDLLPADALQK